MSELILLIEDDDLLRSKLFDLLELEDFNVISAKNWFIGFKIAQELKPNLIICDIDSPCFEKNKFFISLRNNSMINKIPFIFITSGINRNNCVYCLGIYTRSCLTKPIQIEKLLAEIDMNLNNKKNRGFISSIAIFT